MRPKVFLYFLFAFFAMTFSTYLYIQNDSLDQPVFAEHFIYEENKNLENINLSLTYAVNRGNQFRIVDVSAVNEPNIEFTVVGDHIGQTDHLYEFHRLYLTPRTRNSAETNYMIKELTVSTADGSTYTVPVGQLILTETEESTDQVFNFVSGSGSSTGAFSTSLLTNDSLIITGMYLPFKNELEQRVSFSFRGDYREEAAISKQPVSSLPYFTKNNEPANLLKLEANVRFTIMGQITERESFISYKLPVKAAYTTSEKNGFTHLLYITEEPYMTKKAVQQLLAKRREQTS